MICFGCRAEGHIEANCPNAAFDSDGRPPWCGICDERTRLLGLDEAHRCPACHPQRHAQLKQCRKCPSCHQTVYEWDNAPCGHHAGPTSPDRRPDREAIRNVVAAAYEPKDAA